MGRSETGRTGARFGAPARRSRHTPDPETEQEPGPGPDGTGAGTGSGAVIIDTATDDGAVTEADAVTDAEQGLGLTGARFGGRARKSRKERQSEKRQPEPPVAGDPPPATPAVDTDPTVELPRVTDEPAVAIAARPYVLTGGRTKVSAELRIETMISATGPPAGESGERHTVISLCARPRSVSEVAALTGVPLGVARVLIDDLATEGRLRVHLGVDPNGGPDMALLDRVLSGLRRL